MTQDDKQSTHPHTPAPKVPSREVVENTEKDPAVERGERIDTGKQIARSGKSEGKVPGAE